MGTTALARESQLERGKKIFVTHRLLSGGLQLVETAVAKSSYIKESRVDDVNLNKSIKERIVATEHFSHASSCSMCCRVGLKGDRLEDGLPVNQ